MQDLIRRMAETEAALEALTAGQVDAVLDPSSGTPILLRQAQEALRQSEGRLRMLLERLPAIVWTTDSELRYTSASGAGMALIGRQPNELVGTSLHDYSPRDENALTALAAHRRALQGERVTQDLEWAGRTFQACVEPLRDAEGAIIGCLGVALDITQRVQAEEGLRQAHDELESRVQERTAQLDQANRALQATQEQLQDQVEELATSRQMLEAERQRYLNLFEFAPDGYLVTTPEGIIQEANRAAAALLQVDQDFLVGKPLLVFVDQENRKSLRADLARLQMGQGRQLLGWEMRLQPYGGSPFHAALTAGPVYGAEGNPVRLRWLLRDTSQRVQMEEALRESEQKFRSLVEQSPDGIALVDEEGTVIEWNRAQEQISGLKQSDVLGRPVWDVQFQTIPQERKSPVTHQQLKASILQFLKKGSMPSTNQVQDYDMELPDGTRQTMQALVFPIKTGKGFMLGSISRDVTARRQAEEERERLLAQVQRQRQRAQELAETLERERDTLQTIMENTYTQLAYLDPHFNFLRVNAAYAQGAGHRRGGLIGRNHFELFPNEENQAIFEGVRDTGQPVEFHARPFEYADQPERGTTYWDWTLVPVQDAAGQVLGLVLSLHDVSEQVQAEKEREEHQARLQKLIQVSQEVLAEKTREGLLQRVVDAARELTGARIGASGWGYQDGAFEIGTTSQPEDVPPPSVEHTFGMQQGGVHLDLIQREASVRWTDEQLRAHPTWGALPEDHALLRGLLGARLGGGDGQATGLIMVSDKEQGDFTPEDEALLVQLATLAWLALQHIQARSAAERRAAELDATFSAIADGVTICGLQGEIIRINPAAERILGYSSQERAMPLVERAALLQLKPADGQSLASLEEMPAHRALRGETVRNVPMAMRTLRSEERRWISISAAPVQAPDGSALGSVVSFTDITELRRARDELELRVQERTAELAQANEVLQYQAHLLANVSDAVIATDAQLMITAWNRAAEEMYGWKAEEVLGRRGAEPLQPEYIDGDQAGVLRSLAETGRWRGEVRHQRRDGTPLVCEVTSVALKDEAGQVTGYIGVNRDITQRRQAEEALRQSEAAYRTLAENLPGIVYRVFIRENLRMQFFNKVAETLTGYTGEQLSPGTVCSIDPLILPEDRPRVIAEVQRAVAENRPFTVEYRLRHRDGNTRYMLEQGTPIRGPDGEPLYIDGVIFDITQRRKTEEALRQSEERFRQLAEHIREVFWMSDPDITQMHYVSPAYEEIWGRPCQSLYAEPRSFLEGIHPEDREHFLAISQQRMRTGYDVEYRVVRPDGRIRWIRDRAFPIRDEAGEVYRVAGLAQDITARKRAEESLRQQAQIIDQIHDSVICTDMEGYVTSWNKGAERLTGYAAAEALGQHVSFLYTEEQQEFLQHEVIEPLQIKGVHEIEAWMVKKGGEPIYVHLSLSLLRDNTGIPSGMVGYSMDITRQKQAEKALQVQAHQQAAIAELGQRALTETDLSALMDRTVPLVAQTLEVEYCKILELLPDGDELLLRAGVGWREGLVGQVTLNVNPGSQMSYSLYRSEVVIVEDLRTETRFRRDPLLLDHGAVSGLSVVIHGPEQPFGVLGAYTSHHRTFSQDDVHFLQAVANVLATALERKRTEEALQRYVLRLEFLQKIDRVILAAQSPGEIADAALRHVLQLLVPCERASVALFDFETDEAVLLAVSARGDTRMGPGEHIPLEAYVDVTPLQQGQYQLVDDLQAMERQSPVDEQLLAEGLRSAMRLPLICRGELTGCLCLGAAAPQAFSPEHVETARQLANSLAIAIQNARLFEQVRAGQEQLRRLTRQVVTAQEEDRRRVSRELHDEAGQALTALKINLELLQADLPPEPGSLRQSLSEAIALTDATMDEMRRLAHTLRPPALDAVGLNPTLEDLCREFARRTHLSVEYVGTELPALPDAVTICFYRVLQESLTNAARHAGADQIRVALRHGSHGVSLSVEDNGRGFDPGGVISSSNQEGGIGLLGMRERLELLGGRLEINSRPGRGTRLVACIPRRESA
jgi:PAS domain S-box-containing protein